MTFVVGLMCCDGVVLCTDSLEDDGITKKTVDKIKMFGTTHWGIALSGAGPAPILDKFGASLSAKVPRSQFDQASFETIIEDQLAEFNSKYVQSYNDRFHVIVAMYQKPTTYLLYKGSCIEGQSAILTPIRTECHTGMAHELWRMLSDTLYKSGNSVADNTRLAIFGINLAIKYASGVDKPIQLISYTFGGDHWESPSWMEQLQISAQQGSISEAIQRHWRIHNPPTHTEQLQHFKSITTPGDELILLEGVDPALLRTLAGRKEASLKFLCNADTLRRRANADRKRLTESGQAILPSVADSSRK